MRFIPTIRHELEQIRNGMKTRGVPLNVITFVKAPAMTTEYMIIPFIMRCIKVADELSAAALTRGLGGLKHRTSIAAIGFTAYDLIIALLSAGLLVWSIL